MKQEIIHWLLNYPQSAYDRIKESIWMHRPVGIKNHVRVRLARLLMGED